MTEFSYDGRRYQVGKLAAIDQDPIVRKLSRIVPAIVQIFMDDERIMKSLKASVAGDHDAARQTVTPEAALDLFTKNFGKITDAIASISDEDSRFILSKCLSAVSVQPPGSQGWQPIWNQQAGCLQYADLEEDLLGIYWIVFNVLRAKLANFIVGALRNLTDGRPV